MRRLLLAPLALTALLTGCAEDVVLPPTPDAVYTLWGAFDPSVGRQAIRVVPLDRDIEPDPAGPIDATVTVLDFGTGATETWRDSLVTYANGTSGHIFLSNTPVTYENRYRVEVRRSDGVTARATVEVPPFVQPLLEADPGITEIESVSWPGAPQLNVVQVVYLVESADCVRREVTIPYEGVSTATEFGWRTSINLAEEYVRLRQSVLDGLPHALARITIRGEVASADWRYPTGVFDPTVLEEPGAFTNVEGGFGFVGAAYRAEFSWQPDNRALMRAGIPQPGFGCN